MNLKNLDFKTAGFWPNSMKFVAYGVAFMAVIGLSWLLWFSSETTRLNGLQSKELELRKDFEKAQGQANNLPGLKNQLAEIDVLLANLVQRLPSKNEIPDLVVNVSQAALGNGLQVDLFEPQAEVAQDFYAEKKIDVRLRGGYHQLGKFFSDVAKQPRLVAVVVDDMKLESLAPDKTATKDTTGAYQVEPPPVLAFSGSVRTYRYLAEDEMDVDGGEDADAKKGKKGKPDRASAAKDKKEKAAKAKADKEKAAEAE